jgi:acyl-CoA thioesterase FadM
MKEYEFNVRVRYAETDQMVVYHIMLSILRWDAWNGLETLGFHTNGWKKTELCSSSFSEY